MALSPRLLRPRASGSGLHPEAFDWISRVTANGGTASSNTLAAVSTFCTTIDAAGIRDRFYRLNLFCGEQLAAALVPLYRGPVAGGTVFGSATDGGVGLVSGDYTSTGMRGGSGKAVATTLLPSTIAALCSAHHMAVMTLSSQVLSASWLLAGTDNFPTNTMFYRIRNRNGADTVFMASNADVNSITGPRPSSATLLTGVSESGSLSFYHNSTLVSSGPNTPPTSEPFAPYVMAGNRSGGIADPSPSTIAYGGYSLGNSMGGGQVSSYSAAMSAFQAAIGRV